MRFFRGIRNWFSGLCTRFTDFFHRHDDSPKGGGNMFVDYYGCPNSQKAQKLQMKKKLVEFK